MNDPTQGLTKRWTWTSRMLNGGLRPVDFRCGRQKFMLLILLDSTEIAQNNFILYPMFRMTAVM